MIDIITGNYTFTRFEKGCWGDDGRFKKGNSKQFELDANIQPATGAMVKLLPEHKRNAETLVVFTEERLFPASEKSQRSGDILHYDGKKFEMFSVKKWADETDIPHYESIAILIDGEGVSNDI